MKLSSILHTLRLKGGGTLTLDYLRITARGGTGGQGLEMLGGVGGAGGDVYLTATAKQTLLKLSQEKKNTWSGQSGRDSRKFGILGLKGKDVEVPVPVGITISDIKGNRIGELNRAKEKLLIAEGGDGGSPQTAFVGKKGAHRTIQLDLKLIADIGLVGFPNAGKSTLLSRISRAKPRIGAYPFTTVRPEIGIIEYEDSRQISMADLPGLIEGAHRNVGMGHKFLKHVERTMLLLVMVDVHGFKLNAEWPFRTALETVLLLNKEIEHYNPELLLKPAVLCLNKIDTREAHKNIERITQEIKDIAGYQYLVDEDMRPEQLMRFHDILTISAKKKDSVDELKIKLRNILDEIDEYKRVCEARELENSEELPKEPKEKRSNQRNIRRNKKASAFI